MRIGRTRTRDSGHSHPRHTITRATTGQAKMHPARTVRRSTTMRQTTRGQRPRENHSIKARLGPTPGRSTGKVLLRRRSVGDGDGTVKVRNLEPVKRRLDFFARTLTAGVLMSSDGLFDGDTAQVQVLRCAFRHGFSATIFASGT